MKFTLTLIVKKSIRQSFSLNMLVYQLFPITSLEVYQDSTNARVPRLQYVKQRLGDYFTLDVFQGNKLNHV